MSEPSQGKVEPTQVIEHPQTQQQNRLDVPDGGLKAWTTVLGASFVLFATFGYVYSFGVYNDFYVRVYLVNHSPSSIAWIGSLQLMLPFIMGILSGKLFDDGYFHYLEAAGGLLFTFSVFMLSLAKPLQYYQIFLSQGVGMGIGVGLTFVPTVSIIVHHFRRKRGLASGIALCGVSVGGVIFPIMLNHLIPSVGFASAVRSTGYIIVGFLIIGNLLMRTRFSPRGKFAEIQAPDIKSFFTDVPYMFTVVGGLAASLGVYFPVLYLQLYAIQHAVDNKLAFYSIAILNGSSIIGRVSGNHLADLYGAFNVQVPCTLFTAVTIYAVLGVHTAASLVVVSILYGIFSGAWLALAFAGLSSLAKAPNEVGARTGLSLALSSFGSLCSAPIQGVLLTGNFHWVRPITFSGSMMVVGAFFYGCTRMLLARQRSSQRV